MANPNSPVAAGFPIPPPVTNLPIGMVRENGNVYLTPTFFEFLQELWAAIQGQGGIIDIIGLLLPNAGVVGGQIDSQLSQDPRAAIAQSPLLGMLAAYISAQPPALAPIQFRETSPSPIAWTPTVAGSTVAGVQTYSVQSGWAAYIGPLVVLTFNIQMTALDPATAGAVRIAGLPMPTALSGTAQSGFISNFGGVTLTAGMTQLGGRALLGGSVLNIRESGSGLAGLNVQAAALSATTNLSGGFCYFR